MININSQSGRSLLEVIAVMAIGAALTVGVLATYNTLRNRQTRVIATSVLEKIARDTKLLMGARNDYTGVSVDYLIKAGALKTNKSPIGGNDWSVESSVDGSKFLINLTGLSGGDCAYFTTVKYDWAQSVRVNGSDINPGDYCISSNNNVSFIIE